MSSANSRYLAPKVPGGLMMSTGTEFTPGEELILQQLGSISYSTGDILYWNGTQLTNLAIGSTNKVLTVIAGIPSWQTSASGSGTVTTVSVATANGFSGTVANATTTPAITIVAGAITPTSVNGLTISTSTGTLTITNLKTFAVTNTLTLSGTDSTTMTFPSSSATVAGLAIAQTWSALQKFTNADFAILGSSTGYTLLESGLSSTSNNTLALPITASDTLAGIGTAQTWTAQNKFNNIIDVNNAVSVTSNAGTVPVTFKLNTFTNSSASAMTITLATASAVDGQITIVRIYDFSAVAETITWTNTENSTVSVPPTSNGSTSLPLTVGFMFNSQTTKWRCIASA